MTTKRRPRQRYRTETHSSTTSTNGNGSEIGIISRVFFNVILPIVMAGMFAGVVTLFIFYVSGSQLIAQHTDQIKAQDVRISDLVTKIQQTKQQDEERRGNIRDEFLKRSEQTADGIAKLNTFAAVSDNTMKQVLVQLEKLNARMETITQILPTTRQDGHR